MVTLRDPKARDLSRVRQVGRYRHYKGDEYEIIGFAQHTETGEECVVYRRADKPQHTHDLWVRPASMFFENVIIDGVPQPRFERMRGCHEDAT